MSKALGPSKVRQVARGEWGNVNSCKQVVPGVWAVDTEGHGGYLVAVGPDEPFQLDERLRVGKFQSAVWTAMGEPVVAFYRFEEDCDWAVLLLAHPELRVAENKRGDFVDPMSLSVEYLRDVVERWNPEFLAVAA